MKLKLSQFAILLLLFVVLAQAYVFPFQYEGGGSGGVSTPPANSDETDNPAKLLRDLYDSEKPTYSLARKADPSPNLASASNSRALYTAIDIPIFSPYVAQILIEWGIWGWWKKPALYVPFYYICGGELQF